MRQKITIHFTGEDLSEESLKAIAEAAGMSVEDLFLDEFSFEAQAFVSLDQFDDDIIEREYENRFGDTDIAGRAYRLLAEGDTQAAMELMADAYSFRSPDHERRIAALIARGRAKEARHAQG